MMKTVRFIVVAVVLLCCLRMAGQTFIVVDSQDKRALPSASVFDKNGTLLCVCSTSGRSVRIGDNDYPLTVRYLGYHEKEIAAPCAERHLPLTDFATGRAGHQFLRAASSTFSVSPAYTSA